MSRAPLQPTTVSQRHELAEIVAAGERNLADSYELQDYLEERGIGQEVANGFRLGEMGEWPGYERYAGMLIIPFLRQDEEPLTVRFRCWSRDCEHNGHGKYMSLPHDPARLFNAKTVLTAGQTIAIAEGEMDTITLEAMKIPAVGLPGANSWQPHYYHVLEGFNQILLFGDPDEAGMKMNKEIQKFLPSARVVHLPYDVNATVRMEGEETVWQAIERATA